MAFLEATIVANSAMKTFILFLIIASFCLIQSPKVQAWGQKYLVIIKNNIPGPLPLSIHCYSKDDDIGFHVLNNGNDFRFHFGVNFWGTTKFWCDFWWNSKHTSFDVFNSHVADDYCGNNLGNKCFWSATPSGFSIANKDNPSSGDLHFLNSW